MYGDLIDQVDQRVISAMLVSVQVILAYLAIMWLALAYWTWRDIRRRTTDRVVQGASVLLTLLFFVPGYWVYLLLRPALTLSEQAEERLREEIIAEYTLVQKCPYCREKVKDEYVVCPQCNFTLREACKGCSHALQPGWSVCPYCAKTTGRERQPDYIGVPAIGVEPKLAAVGE